MHAHIRFVDFQTSARPARDLLVAVVAAAGAFILPSPVSAQSDAAALGSVAETVSLPNVTVTARKREESLQETPIPSPFFLEIRWKKRTCATCATSGSTPRA